MPDKRSTRKLLVSVPGYEYNDGRVKRTIRFVPISNVPGFTHRVIVDQVACDWLSDDHKPNKRVALFFLDKHKPSVAASPTQANGR